MTILTWPKLVWMQPPTKPRILTPHLGWAKPHVSKTLEGDWECSVLAYLHHGTEVTVFGRHKELDLAWTLMVDHLVRHNMYPTFESTKGPGYV